MQITLCLISMESFSPPLPSSWKTIKKILHSILRYFIEFYVFYWDIKLGDNISDYLCCLSKVCLVSLCFKPCGSLRALLAHFFCHKIFKLTFGDIFSGKKIFKESHIECKATANGCDLLLRPLRERGDVYIFQCCPEISKWETRSC